MRNSGTSRRMQVKKDGLVKSAEEAHLLLLMLLETVRVRLTESLPYWEHFVGLTLLPSAFKEMYSLSSKDPSELELYQHLKSWKMLGAYKRQLRNSGLKINMTALKAGIPILPPSKPTQGGLST